MTTATTLSALLNGGGAPRMVEFTASGIFDPAALGLQVGDVIHVLGISAGGGGGNGGSGYGASSSAMRGGNGGGGGAGTLVERFIVLRDLAPIVVTVGASAAQQEGGATSFGAHFSLPGGKRGVDGTAGTQYNPGTGGTGGASATLRAGGIGGASGNPTAGRGAGAMEDAPLPGGINGYCQGGGANAVNLTPQDWGCGGNGGIGGANAATAATPGAAGGHGFVRVMYWR